jgi:hypothetical protein
MRLGFRNAVALRRPEFVSPAITHLFVPAAAAAAAAGGGEEEESAAAVAADAPSC